MINDTLKNLLIYAKTTEEAFTWKSVAATLAPLYHNDMRLTDVLVVLLKSYNEAIKERRFAMRGESGMLETLLTAPIAGSTSVTMLGPINGVETLYTVEQFYNSIISRIMNDLRFTRVDWLVGTPDSDFLEQCITINKENREK